EPRTAMRPRSGTRVPASVCISVDLPAPLWPTRPMHSPASTLKSTPSSARTAPKCFSTPSSFTMFGRGSGISVRHSPRSRRARSFLEVGLDRLDRVFLRVFRAGHATDFDRRQDFLESVLCEGEIRHDQIVWNVV